MFVLSCHPEPCPESSHVILNSFQDQGLRFQGLIYLFGSEPSSE
jgi:hypothetical protein